MENEPFKVYRNGEKIELPAQAVNSLVDCYIARFTGQLTFHFASGTVRQIQRNAFETVK